jgi:RNA polymerase sigma-70 factor (sigma-E family)
MRAGDERDCGRAAEFAEYATARAAELRRVAYLLCQDWHHADDLVQGAFIRLYLRWNRARAVEHVDAYARTVLVREFLREQRSGWARRVTTGLVPDRPGPSPDHDAAVDVRAAMAGLPARQRATLVLRFYCDLNIDQTADVLGCSAGTVKSQTSKGLTALRHALRPAPHPAGAAGGSAYPHAPADQGKGIVHG